MKLENILDLSLNEYLISVGKRESDYHVKGVRVSFSGSIEPYKGSLATPDGVPEAFGRALPEDAEAVVNYKETYLVALAQERSRYCTYTPFQCIVSGVVLIPKVKPSE